MSAELNVIPVIPFQNKASMSYLFEQLTYHLGEMQKQGYYKLIKTVPPQLQVPQTAHKYMLFFRYQLAKHYRYPRIVKNLHGDFFLIIDHSYAHLTAHVPCSNVAVFCHDLIPLELPALLKSRIEYLLYRKCVNGLRKAKKIIAISNHTQDLVMKHLKIPKQSIEVIPLGVSEKFQPYDEEKIKLCKKAFQDYKDEILLLHIGHCARYKNIECLLQMLNTLNRQAPGKYRLLKIGGPFKTQHEQMIRNYNLGSSISHIPEVSISSLVEYYNISDFLVMPSIIEGQGLPVLEAFKCKLPVICSNIKPFHEIAENAAVFLDPGKPDDWASYILQSPDPRADHAKNIANGLAATQNYTWENCARKVLDVFREMGL